MLLLLPSLQSQLFLLALFSQVKAQKRSLALVMMVGIILDWIVTRYVLENFYIEQKRNISEQNPYKVQINPFDLGLAMLTDWFAFTGIECTNGLTKH